MSQTLGVDYSFSRPSPALLAAKGFKFACRYLGGSTDKRITRAEAAALHSHGLAIPLVYESAANRSAQGYATGVADAREALREAGLVGVPSGIPIFFAVDFDAAWWQVEPYFKGVQHVLGVRGGPYGSDKITRAARGIGIKYTWQTCAWSGGRLDTGCNIYQRQAMTRFVAGCDEDVLINAMPMWGLAAKVAAAPATTQHRTNFVTARIALTEAINNPANPPGSPAHIAASRALNDIAPFSK